MGRLELLTDGLRNTPPPSEFKSGSKGPYVRRFLFAKTVVAQPLFYIGDTVGRVLCGNRKSDVHRRGVEQRLVDDAVTLRELDQSI